MKPRIARSVPAGKRRLIEGMSQRHVQLICQLHCCMCWAEPPCDPHHLLFIEGEGSKGMGRKHADRWTIPLCFRHHTAAGGPDSVHAGGDDEAVLMRFGVDGRALSIGLWLATPFLPAMERVNFANYQRARLLVAQRECPAL